MWGGGQNNHSLNSSSLKDSNPRDLDTPFQNKNTSESNALNFDFSAIDIVKLKEILKQDEEATPSQNFQNKNSSKSKKRFFPLFSFVLAALLFPFSGEILRADD
ncbi:hypothetical protein, partial [Helicobacter sp. 12S02232-10]|uniref:hypothetical protein n=1 Tax=Helicobacter sp. 12S02232-10 TaxID=1476197 RepID=UPI00117B9622